MEEVEWERKEQSEVEVERGWGELNRNRVHLRLYKCLTVHKMLLKIQYI